MYQVEFLATTSAGWAEAISLVDDDSNLPLDLTGITFELDVRDDCDYQALTATTENTKLETLAGGVVQWRFSPDEVRPLYRGRTYRVGLVARDSIGPTQIFVGTLSFIDGIAR